MANTTSISNNTTNANNFSPTGLVNIVSGLGNPYPLACANNQQINVGDALFQNNDATFGWIGLPAVCISGNNYASATNNLAANDTAVKLIQGSIHNNFAGFSVGYRSAKNTSYGRKSDRVGVATGRVRVAVDNNLNNAQSAYNTQAASPVGTPWSISVACTNPAANNANATVNPNLYVVCGNFGNQSGANLAIGRQAEPKGVNDPYVYLDLVSTTLSAGVQEVNTAS